MVIFIPFCRFTQQYGTLSVINSTFASNRASSVGGGIAIGYICTLTVNNSTFFSNTAGYGGGITSESTLGTLTVTFGTLANNTAVYAGGIFSSYSGTVNVRDAIVAKSPAGGNCRGSAIMSSGYNLSSDTACPFSGMGDISNTNPLLGPLQDNGGPTLTIMPLNGSPVIDKGGDACEATDQRGVSRPQGVHCDIGAVEVFIPTHFAYSPTVRR